MAAFSEIPILDVSLADDPSTKQAFLSDLRHALLEVGFFYIKNTGIPQSLADRVKQLGISFFSLPDADKLAVEMKNQPSFLGYSRLGMEVTRFKVDWREQIDLSTPHLLPGPDAPLYHNLLAPNQWPDMPGFRAAFEEYMRLMGDMSIRFTSLIAEAIGLAPDAFAGYFDSPQQHKLKVVKYPEGGTGQGVGPHKDSMLTSYLLQASEHRGLQAQNHAGEWIDCPPVEGTLVVAIGQGMEALTRGVCQSTTHRVLSPKAGEGARYSIPFFQGVSYDATFESMDVPEDVLALREEVRARRGEKKDDVEFTFTTKGGWDHLGTATLWNRIKSHPDVGERWYPEILSTIRQQQASQGKPSEIPASLTSRPAVSTGVA